MIDRSGPRGMGAKILYRFRSEGRYWMGPARPKQGGRWPENRAHLLGRRVQGGRERSRARGLPRRRIFAHTRTRPSGVLLRSSSNLT